MLAEDIEISDFEPIDNFTGTLEGNGKTITVNSIQESECTIPDYEGVPIVGIFAQASGNINNINIKFSDTFEVGTSGLAAGGLVAIASDGLTLTNCSSSGKLEVTGSMSYVGGLVGVVIGEQNELSKLSNEATISASDSSIVGGVVGGIMDSDTYKVNITKSYNKGSITSAEMVGGIIGLVFNSEISNCYNSGEVTNGEDSSTNTAGIGFGNGDASSMKIINCYNTGIIDGGTGYAISSYESTNGTYEGCKFKSGTGIVRGETDGIKVGDISQENLDNLVK